MTVESIWKIPDNISIERTPYVVLSEQAPLLAKLTNEMVRALVSRRITADNSVSISLAIEAPALGSYRVQVLNIRHELISPFPSRVRSSIDGTGEVVDSEHELLTVVKAILESEEMQRMLGSLIRESSMQAQGEDLPF